MAKDVVKVGLIGFGVIGTGVVKLFKNSSDIINVKSGVKVELKKVCDLDITTDRGVSVDKGLLTTDVNDIIEDKEIDIVIELIGGYKPALDFVLKAMKNGKHVVTANKALLSKYWDDVAKASADNKTYIMAEASVGGGIPILRGLNQGLAANKIEKIMAILNGTCNYILTKMSVDKMLFDVALKEAQEKGFAEMDPTLDIEGFDTMHKIAILSTMAFGKRITEEDIFVQGIRGIEFMDIEYGAELRYEMKLLSIAQREGNGVNVRVHPVLISKDHLLAAVKYENNAIAVKGDAAGEVMFYGAGAGEMPTASAILSDVIYIAKNISRDVLPAAFSGENSNVKIMKIDDIDSKYYLRFNVLDDSGVLADISGVLGKYGISIESVIQKGRHATEKVAVVITTFMAKEANMQKALAEIDKKKFIKDSTVLYRIMD